MGPEMSCVELVNWWCIRKVLYPAVNKRIANPTSQPTLNLQTQQQRKVRERRNSPINAKSVAPETSLKSKSNACCYDALGHNV